MVLVSVLITTYHRPQLLEGAINSVIKQTHNEAEIIVVNDDDEDQHTARVLNEYEGESLIAVHNDERVGISASRNIAADIASGEFICILDDDDRWHPQKIEKQLEKFRSVDDDYAIVFTGGEIWNEDGSQLIDRKSPPISREGCVWPEILGNWGMAPHSSHMIRYEPFQEVGGFDEDINRGEDWDLSIRLAKKYKVTSINEPLTVRLEHGGNVSNGLQHVDQRRDILLKHGKDILSKEEIREEFFSIWHQRRGYFMMLNGRRREAIREYYLAAGYDPQKRTMLLLLTSLLGPKCFRALGNIRKNIQD